ncbi:MAG: acyl-CoA dehydrogenase [Pseudomonadota bacterium]
MYRAPVNEIVHTLTHVTGLGNAMAKGAAGDLTPDLLAAIVEEAGRFASEEVAPLSVAGDKQGTPLNDAVVTMPEGWGDLYRRWSEGGWNALTGPERFGGQGLPTALGTAAFEMWNSGSLAFGIGPTLTIGAAEAINAHASDALKATYLEKLVSGEWTGTMNLTEPQSGSDLNGLKARAEPLGDGRYRLFGQKIYITYGEHDMTDNIIHLVLARLPDAPAGQRGISLFLVPKVLVNEDGTLGARNDVFCNGVEHKLGIHASPTCTMIYGDGRFDPDGSGEAGAIGYLVGEENRGLACMFTMMNNARLLVGIQGVAVAEAATQKALAYAKDRKQGKASDYEGEGMAPIVHHPDVQRNLLTMHALTAASRAISYNCAHAIDQSEHGAPAPNGQSGHETYWSDRAALLTPVAKAFSTDIGCEVANIGVQIHGGMGYVEETGAAQLLRDARIAPIYEGTNGIQAIDLVTRKLPLASGAAVRGYLDELDAIVSEISTANRDDLTDLAAPLETAMADLRAATETMLDMLGSGDKTAALCGATPYLRLFGLAAGGVYNGLSALKSEGPDAANRAALARFMAHNLCSETVALRRSIEGGAHSLSTAAPMLLSA